jgi:flagellar capping protein FliD
MSSLSSVGSTSSALTSATSSTSSSSTGTLSVGGLISGLNTTQLIQGLLAVQQAQITAVQNQQTAATQRESAYKTLEAQLLSLQSSVTQLAQPVNGPFDGRTATSSDQTLLTAAASSSAAAGNYSLTVGALANANEIASQNFDSASSKITHGTLTVGSGSTTATITIDSTNDTLQGLATAINGANAGVSATVINDGSSHPYRLLLTANKTGLANAISLDTSGLAANDAGSGAVRPTFGVGAAVAGGSNVGTATVTAGGVYSGTANDAYTLKVTGVTAGGDLSNGGTVTLSYTNGDNSVTGSFTLSAADLNQFHDVAKGVKVKLGPGPLSVNDQFTINTTVATVQNATDASVTLGSGPGAVTVTSASNTVNNVIAGVTLSLTGANTSEGRPGQRGQRHQHGPDGHPELRHELQQRYHHHRRRREIRLADQHGRRAAGRHVDRRHPGPAAEPGDGRRRRGQPETQQPQRPGHHDRRLGAATGRQQPAHQGPVRAGQRRHSRRRTHAFRLGGDVH